MPHGLSVCRWDDKVGLRIVGVYPRNLGVSEDDMLRVFTAHAMGKPEAGFLTMTLEGTNLAVASFYTGILRGRDQFCIMLFMELDEEPRSYEEGLTLASSEIVENIGEPEFVEYLGEVFEKLKRMVELSVEQRLAKVFVDHETRLLMHKLARGGIPAEELREWLELQTGKHYPDLGLVTLPLLRSGLVEEDWINAVSDNCVFLVNDLLGARFPPEQVIKLAKGGGLNKDQFREFETRVKSFFEGYQWTEEDTIMMGQLLLDPDIYDVTKTLRRKITHKSELAGVVEKEASLDNVLRRLEQAQVATKFGENAIEVAAKDDPLIVLMADVHFESFFPEFLVLRIQERLEAKDIHPDIAKRHLELLSETYMRMREKMKERKKRKEEEEAEEELPEMEGEMVPPPEPAEVETPEVLESAPVDEEEAKRIKKEEEKARKEEQKRLKEEEKRLKAEEKQKKKDEEKAQKEEEKKRKEEEKQKKKEEEQKRKEEEKRLKEEEKQKKKEEEQKRKEEEKKRKEEEKKKKKEEKKKEKESS
ncbi:MAG: hypothetical protein ACFFCB_03395 [Candidatus Odinarchaeota archaeon]